MFKISRIPSTFFLCAFTIPFFAIHAENEELPPPVEVRLLFLDESMGEGYSVKTEDSFLKVSSYPYAISNPILRPASTELEIYKNLPPPPPDAANKSPEPLHIKIATLKIPDNSGSILAVLKPLPNETKANVLIYNSDPDNFPKNSIRIINLGITPMGISVNGKIGQIEPGKHAIFPTDPDEKNRVVAKVAQLTKTHPKIIYDGVLILPPENRITGVVVFSPSGMRHTYTELELREFGAPKPRHQWLSYKHKP